MIKRLFTLSLKETIRVPLKLIISVLLIVLSITALITVLSLRLSLYTTVSNASNYNLQININSYKKFIEIVENLIYISFAFILFVLYISVSTILINDKKQLALLKTLGYTNFSIILTAFFSIAIMALLGFILSIPLSYFAVNRILFTLAEKSGVSLYNLFLNPEEIFIALGAVILSSLITLLLLYFKIRKIYPLALMKND